MPEARAPARQVRSAASDSVHSRLPSLVAMNASRRSFRWMVCGGPRGVTGGIRFAPLPPGGGVTKLFHLGVFLVAAIAGVGAQDPVPSMSPAGRVAPGQTFRTRSHMRRATLAVMDAFAGSRSV